MFSYYAQVCASNRVAAHLIREKWTRRYRSTQREKKCENKSERAPLSYATYVYSGLSRHCVCVFITAIYGQGHRMIVMHYMRRRINMSECWRRDQFLSGGVVPRIITCQEMAIKLPVYF